MTNQERATENKMPLTISVIMPVYNGIEFIKQSLPPLVAMRDRGEVLEVLVVFPFLFLYMFGVPLLYFTPCMF